MIPSIEILENAREWGLRPNVVEKDYALGWILAAMAAHPVTKEWVFKGGTCLRKCYFETYRFSEDLDPHSALGPMAYPFISTDEDHLFGFRRISIVWTVSSSHWRNNPLTSL